MSMADGETEVGAGEAARPSLGWADSVAARPIGFGWDAEAVAFEAGRGTPALLLVAANGGRLARFYRPAGERDGRPFYDAGTEVEGLQGLRCLCPFPARGGGRLDLIAIGPDGLVRLRDEGSPDQPRYAAPEPLGLPADLGLGEVRVAQLVAVDWDGDGKLDLLVGLDDLADYWPDGEEFPLEQQVGFDQGGGHPGYDDQGRWRGQTPEGRIRWIKNVGDDEHPRFEVQDEIDADGRPIQVGLHPAPLMISWHVEGNAEFLLADEGGRARVFRNFGGILPPAVLSPRTIRVGDAPLALPEDRTNVSAADLDGDGRAELIGGQRDGRVFAIRTASLDAARPPELITQEPGPLWLGGHAVVAAADLDDDGGLDLVVGDGPGHLSWLKDVGTGVEHRYGLPTRLEAGGDPFRLDPGVDGRLLGPASPRLGYACPAVVDWTGNGRLDLIVGGAGGEVILLRNDGAKYDPRFGSPVGLRCAGSPLVTPPRVRPACARWGGDGPMHLIALNLQGFLCVYRQRDPHALDAPVPLVDSLGRFIRLDGGFGLAGNVSLWAGPWTEPGRVDILVGLSRAAAPFVVPAVTGRPGVPPAGPTVLLLEDRGLDGYVPRVVGFPDGVPLGLGGDACSPSGVSARGDGTLDLLVGSDDGHVYLFRREDLRW
ncbi:hypothetical protein TA3x_003960 [Tundrisphaera sp. TA3]|uniref:hypothetical protein n=1 Tax=Tundrisphaera sp. TA3 TaxID=3435775 RepID=UPI003EBB5FA1